MSLLRVILSVKTKATDVEKDAGVDAVKKLALKFRQSKQMSIMISQNVQFDCMNKKNDDEEDETDNDEVTDGGDNGDNGGNGGATGGNPL